MHPVIEEVASALRQRSEQSRAADNFGDVLALDNVICCGGSWMVSDELVDNGNRQKIRDLARAALLVDAG